MPEKPLGGTVALEFNKDISDTKLAALYAFLDEQIALLRLVSFYFLSASLEEKSKGMSFYRLTIRQIKILASIRLQCTYGLDTNARLQLRLLYENSIVWARFRVDKQALDDFELAISGEAANEFWHKYISKSKTEKYLDSEFGKTGRFWIGGANDLIEELKRKVGASAHPSFIGTYMDTLNDWRETTDGVALSEPSDSSHMTLSYAILSASIPFSIKPEPQYELKCHDILKVEPMFTTLRHPSASWDEYSQKIRDMIPSLFLMAVRFSEGLRNSKD